MGSKTRLSSHCIKRANNGVNLVTSRKINTRLARPIDKYIRYDSTKATVANIKIMNGYECNGSSPP